MKIAMPPDNWGGTVPRDWQSQHLPDLIKHYSKPNPSPGLGRAIMGSGKSRMMAQFAACCQFESPKETIVVSAPKIRLVRQLMQTFQDRLDTDLTLDTKIGAYYTHGKDVHTPIIITCAPSAGELGKLLAHHGRETSLWIIDEAHRTNNETMQKAKDILLPKMILGFSATPYLANEKKSLSLFDTLLFDYGPGRALHDKNVVVLPRYEFWHGQELGIDDCCAEMTKNAIGPGMFNAPTIENAESFAKYMTEHKNFPTIAVHCKLPDAEVDKRLNDLKAGRYRAVVQINMLSEGTDLPWLRWLCFRQPIGSRVAFAQQLGRVLRYYKDPVTGNEKTEAIIYDPHGLSELHSLSPEFVLGGEYDIDDDDSPVEESKKRERILEQSVFELMRALLEANAGKKPLSVEPLAGYLTELVSAFDICGLIDRKLASREWRAHPATQKQDAALQNMKCWIKRSGVPKIHKEALDLITSHGSRMNRGMASDLITIFSALAAKKGWPNFKHLDDSASSGIAKHEAKKKGIILQDVNPPPVPKPSGPTMVQGDLFAAVAASGNHFEEL